MVAQRHIKISETIPGDLVQCSGEVVRRSGLPQKVDNIASESLDNFVGMGGQLRLESVANLPRKTHRAQFVRAQDLFDEMYASLADRSSRKLLNRLARIDVLQIDELGYLNIKPEQANIFFKLMEERYRRHPIITTNLGYDEWHHFLGNRPMVEALLSRLRHYCHTVCIDGPSLREPQNPSDHPPQRGK